MDEEQAPVRENAEAFPKLTCSSQETSSQSFSATGKTVPSTPLFTFQWGLIIGVVMFSTAYRTNSEKSAFSPWHFSFSPGGSPLQGTSHSKAPAFPFSLNSDPSPTVFPGFRFDMGLTQMEVGSEQKETVVFRRLELLNGSVYYFFAAHILWFFWVFFQWEGKTFLLTLQKQPFIKYKTVKQTKIRSVFNLFRKPQIQRLQAVCMKSTFAVLLLLWTTGVCIFFSGPEFVLNQQEQCEDFQFGFTSTSPQKDNKDSGFPFSFNF